MCEINFEIDDIQTGLFGQIVLLAVDWKAYSEIDKKKTLLRQGFNYFCNTHGVLYQPLKTPY